MGYASGFAFTAWKAEARSAPLPEAAGALFPGPPPRA